MITTKYGETIDLENRGVNFDGREYSINDLMHLKNIYMQFATAEYILENNEEYSEQQAWDIAGITRHKMDKYDMSEDEAIEEAIGEFSSQTFTENESILTRDEEIAALVAAGDWHIDEEAFKLFQTAKDPGDVDFVCSVYFGNHAFDFVGREALDEHFYLDYEQYVPIESVDAALHTHTEGQLDKKEFRFELSPGELDLAFYNEQSDIGTFARTDENKVSIEAFKRSVVKRLLDDKMIAMKPDEYKFMHDNDICYHQQFYKQRDEYLSKLAEKDKLTPDELIGLARFYFYDSYSSKDMSARIEKIVDKMDQAGFPETKKTIMLASMTKLINDPIDCETFRNTIKMYSDKKNKDKAENTMTEIKVTFFADVDNKNIDAVKKGFYKHGAQIISEEFPELNNIGSFKLETKNRIHQ